MQPWAHIESFAIILPKLYLGQVRVVLITSGTAGFGKAIGCWNPGELGQSESALLGELTRRYVNRKYIKP